MRVAHLPLDLRLGNESGHGVDHDDVQTARADEHVGDLKGLLTGVRLGDEKIVGVNAQGLGVNRVKSVFGIDEGRVAPRLLGTGDGMERHGGLAGGLGTVDLDDAASRESADSQSDIECGGAGGDDGHRRAGLIPQAHD